MEARVGIESRSKRLILRNLAWPFFRLPHQLPHPVTDRSRQRATGLLQLRGERPFSSTDLAPASRSPRSSWQSVPSLVGLAWPHCEHVPPKVDDSDHGCLQYALLSVRTIAAIAVFAAASPAFAEDFSAEAEQLASEIVGIHPRGREIAESADFIAARDELLAMADAADLPHYAIALGRMFHAVDDGHTAAIPIYGEQPEFTGRYPFRLRRFEDGMYVIAAKGAAAPLLGARLTHIADKPVDQILRDFVAAQASGNRAWPANWTALGLSTPGFLIGLDVAPSDLAAPLRFDGVGANDGRVTAQLTASSDGSEGLTEIGRKEGPLDGLGDGAINFAVEISDGRALLFAIGAMEDEEKKTFEAFTREALAALETTKSGRIIIDLRDNGGGNNMVAEPLRRILIKSRFNRSGGIYVLTSPQTFSAAMNFATRLERETDALFVGEPTGGSPNHFGDPKFAQGNVSKIPYIISTLRWQDSTPLDARPWILPDIPAPPGFSDYVAGRDVALERALTHEVAGDPDWQRRIVKPWERASQMVSWRFFYERPE